MYEKALEKAFRQLEKLKPIYFFTWCFSKKALYSATSKNVVNIT